MDISPAQWLEKRQARVYADVRSTIKEAFTYVDYGKTAAASSVIPADDADLFKEESLETLGGIYENIVKLVNDHQYGHNIDENYCVPVVNGKKSNINSDYSFPVVSNKPAIEALGLRGILKPLDFFVDRFGGVAPGVEENMEELVRSYPFVSLLRHGYMAEGEKFRKLSRNVFINDNTKTTLIFLGGAEKYRQIDMLFSASVSAIRGLPGVAECIAFYPDLMCAEYDFIGLGLRELLLEGRDGLAKAKLECIGAKDKVDIGPLRERLLQLMPFIVLEMCDVVKNLNDFGLCLTKASPNNFALDVKGGQLRPVLTNLDCLKPKGHGLGGYDLPQSMVGACAPEMAGANPTVTEAMSSYMIGKVVKETLDLAVNTAAARGAKPDTAAANPSKALKISPEVCGIIDIITDASPENRCPVRVLIKAIQNVVEYVASSE